MHAFTRLHITLKTLQYLVFFHLLIQLLSEFKQIKFKTNSLFDYAAKHYNDEGQYWTPVQQPAKCTVYSNACRYKFTWCIQCNFSTKTQSPSRKHQGVLTSVCSRGKDMQLVKCGYFLPDMCAQGTKLRSKLSTLVLPWQFIQKKNQTYGNAAICFYEVTKTLCPLKHWWICNISLILIHTQLTAAHLTDLTNWFFKSLQHCVDFKKIK